MLHIDTRRLLRRHDILFIHLFPTLVVFLALLGITFVSWNASKRTVHDEQVKVLHSTDNAVATSLKQRIESYASLLEGGAGLFDASENVTRAEWSHYVQGYHLNDEFPGVQEVGFITIVPADQLSEHIAQVQQDGFPSYTISPGGDRSLYTSIIYVEPSSGTNLKTFGYDPHTEPVRQKAMDVARDTGQVTMSSLVNNLPEMSTKSNNPGFVMYMPVYGHGSTLTTTADRQAALTGYVFSPFQMENLVNNLSSRLDAGYGFQIYSLDKGTKKLAYQSQNFDEINGNSKKQSQTNQITLHSQAWQITGVVSPDVVAVSTRNRPPGVLYGGLAFSFFVAGFIYLLLLNRMRLLASQEEDTIQTARDELLALASHQLRTPATGVKQYVGMLREGFAGKLSPLQKKLLDKAYDSNERQLGTINEMLFVARADAGHLKMDTSRINLSAILQQISEENLGSIKQRRQKQQLRLPKRATYIMGDKQYLRMALENVISNATKYTPDEGSITISLTTRAKEVIIKIRDTGVGVSEEDQELLFKKFSRIPNELTNKVSGSGIGLYLAKKVVDSHGGIIVLESNGEKGSTVVISLPKTRPA